MPPAFSVRTTPRFDRLAQRLLKRHPDFQEILGRTRARASQSQPSPGRSPNLERATKIYRKLAAKYHPDRNPATAEVMKDLNEFWQALK